MAFLGKYYIAFWKWPFDKWSFWKEHFGIMAFLEASFLDK
jgi:hypothetical protein